ncbi:hypothetical protein M153_2470007595 [Pseudoloma neurophilia]|uniref:Transposable element n=1 Tax=Pseudoloma neurophilia TaxID=146866 RepID=A0A0R0LYV1_9MICR|nr:hypothetical protein M153_2470007595 [Pseudoloma neurophilia]
MDVGGMVEANALKILRSVIHSKFRKNVSKEKLVYDVMNALLKIPYFEKYNMRIIQYLNNLKLTQFQTIDEYIINIQTVLEILKLNNSYTLNELDHKEKEIFLNGLNDEIITWFTGQGLESPSKMITRSKQVENQLIIVHRRQTNILRTQNGRKNQTSLNDPKTVEHDDQKKNVKDKTASMNNISKYSVSLPNIILHICGVKTSALIDSCARHSFISSELLSTMKVISTMSEELTLLIADGSKVQTKYHVILDIKLGSNPTIT